MMRQCVGFLDQYKSSDCGLALWLLESARCQFVLIELNWHISTGYFNMDNSYTLKDEMNMNWTGSTWMVQPKKLYTFSRRWVMTHLEANSKGYTKLWVIQTIHIIEFIFSRWIQKYQIHVCLNEKKIVEIS